MLTIFDYAINLTPNEQILAGDTGSEICSATTETNVVYVTADRVKFSWLPVDDATEYQVRIRLAGTAESD